MSLPYSSALRASDESADPVDDEESPGDEEAISDEDADELDAATDRDAPTLVARPPEDEAR